MPRRSDWPERLAAFIEARRARAFSWGDNDCALFAADWVAECTGTDPATSLRGTYGSAAEAVRIVHAQGGLAAIADAALVRWQSTLMAGRGDIALAENAGRELLCVVAGEYLIAPGPAGVVFMPLDAALTAWKV